jgi:hypothetical protein
MFAASFGISIFGPGEPGFFFPSLPFKPKDKNLRATGLFLA